MTDINGILSTNWQISANDKGDNSQMVSILFNWLDYKDGLEFICPSGKCIFESHLLVISYDINDVGEFNFRARMAIFRLLTVRGMVNRSSVR